MLKERFKNSLNLWLPVVVWAFVIFIFSSRPTGTVSEIDWTDFIFKKSLHIIEYGVLTILLYRALRLSFENIKLALFFSFLISIFYGVSDEYHQSFTPGRQPHFRDVVIDGLGSVLVIYFILFKLGKSPLLIKNLAKKFDLI